jgi:hypothetical protein
MINPGDIVRLRDRTWLSCGLVKRVNWNEQAEVEWKGSAQDKISLMHKLSDLEPADPNKEKLEYICKKIPQIRDMTQAWENGRWEIAKPIAAHELKFWARIKNAWLVLTGKAFVVRWY